MPIRSNLSLMSLQNSGVVIPQPFVLLWALSSFCCSHSCRCSFPTESDSVNAKEILVPHLDGFLASSSFFTSQLPIPSLVNWAVGRVPSFRKNHIVLPFLRPLRVYARNSSRWGGWWKKSTPFFKWARMRSLMIFSGLMPFSTFKRPIIIVNKLDADKTVNWSDVLPMLCDGVATQPFWTL